MLDELVELVEGGHEIGPSRSTRSLGGARPGRRHPRRLRRRRLAPPRQEDRAEDGHPEAVRRRDPRLHGHVRDRPGGHGQDVPRDRARRRGALGAPGRPHHPHPPGRRGRRAARVPPRRHAREGRPVHAAAVRRALRHDGRRAARRVHGARHDRGRAARVHARPHAQRLVHHPRRGAEHEPGADADVPDPTRLRLEDGRHRRRHADRPPTRAGVRADPGAARSSTASTAIAFVEFTHEDVVRHKLVQRIVEAYKRHAEETGTQRSR